MIISLPWEEGFYLYRIYDVAGRLLYIGATTSLVTRMGAHRNQRSLWINEVESVEWQCCESKAVMLELEKLAIGVEQPIYNETGFRMLSSESVAEIRSLYATGDEKQVDLARAYGVKQSTISRVVRELVHKGGVPDNVN